MVPMRTDYISSITTRCSYLFRHYYTGLGELEHKRGGVKLANHEYLPGR